MTIESTAVSKEYAKEGVNAILHTRRLIKNPTRPVINYMIVLPVWMIIALAVSAWCVRLLLVYRRMLYALLLGCLLITFIFAVRFFIGDIKCYKSLRAPDRHITYRLSEEGLEYDDNKNKKVFCYWNSIQCIRRMKYGGYLIPKDTSGIMIGMGKEELRELEAFLGEKGIDIRMIPYGA